MLYFRSHFEIEVNQRQGRNALNRAPRDENPYEEEVVRHEVRFARGEFLLELSLC